MNALGNLRDRWPIAVAALVLAVSVGAVILGGRQPEPADTCSIGQAAIHDLVDWAVAQEFDESVWNEHAERIDIAHRGWGPFLKSAVDDPPATGRPVTDMLIALVDDCAPLEREPAS